MDLEERIARLIHPEAWSRWDNQPSGDIKQGSARTNWTIGAARRVIDGLGLTEQTRTMCDGLMPNGRDTYGDTIEHRLITPWEDA